MSDHTSPLLPPEGEGEKRPGAPDHQDSPSLIHQNTAGILLTLIGALCLIASIWYTSARVVAQSDYNCTAPYRVDETLPTGARWEWCWEQRFNEGVILHDVYFTPPGGPRRLVLATASVSQIHVPYDDNGGRFHDVSDFGLGSQFLLTLNQGECPNGALIPWGGRNVICKQIAQRGYAQKYYSQRELQGWQLSFWSIGSSGDYNYIAQWNFNDDGSIVPTMGAAGKLQRYGVDERYGWRTQAANRIPISHYHNYWFKLDFDIDGLGNDQAQEIQFNPADNNQRREISVEPILTETARDHDPNVQRSWRVIDTVTRNGDGRPISYHIEALDSGHQFNGPAYEPFTFHDIYITRAKACERYASHNPTTGGCASDASTFVNGEDVNGQDVVIWYGISYHHLPRDEDEGTMNVHWSSFTLSPRDWTSTNPLDTRTNQGPTSTPTATQMPPTATPTLTPTVTATTSGEVCTNLVTNPGFELTTGWTFGPTPRQAAYVNAPVLSGTRAARMGITRPDDNIEAYSSVYQMLDLPATSGTLRLSYWERQQRIGAEELADYRESLLLNEEFGVLRALNRTSAIDTGWYLRTFDVTSFAGQRVALYFNVYNNGAGSVLSNVIDDVSLALCDNAIPDAGLKVEPQYVTLLDTDLPLTVPISVSAVSPSAPLNWQAAESTAWLTMTASSGSTPGVVDLLVGKVEGEEVASSGTITFTASEPYNSTALVEVTVLRGLNEQMFLPAIQQ